MASNWGNQPPGPPGSPGPQQPGQWGWGPPPGAAPGMPPPQFNPYAPPQGYGPPHANATSSQAQWALGLAIASWMMCGCFTSLPAVFLAKSELNAIERGDSPAGGKGFATAAFWISVVNLILYGLFVLFYIGFFAFAMGTSGSRP